MKTISSFDFKNEIALIRVDFNVPQDYKGNVTDITRILASKPTIDKILSDGGSIVLMTHLGRPNGEISLKYSLKSIISTISDILKVPIKFIDDCIGEKVINSIRSLETGEILLLENLRFYLEEEKGDIFFSEKLSKNGTIYVNDAFGASHRSHASISTITNFFKEKKCFGFLMEKELNALNIIMKSGNKPITAILGGSKISTKIPIIYNILPSINNLIIGGGMVYTFIKALGGNIGNSIFEKDKLDLAFSIFERAKKYNVKLYLPVDTLVAPRFSNYVNTKLVPINEIPEGFQGLDIGKESIKKFKDIILNSKTILWNGPLGVFEMEKFSFGTKSICNMINQATKKFGAFSLVGGGDTIAFIKKNNYDFRQFSYISTGGGAMLEALSGKILPGVEAILN